MISSSVDQLLQRYEQGALTRRDLLAAAPLGLAAIAQSPAISRAKSSEITTTPPPVSISFQVMSRPAIIRVPMASK